MVSHESKWKIKPCNEEFLKAGGIHLRAFNLKGNPLGYFFPKQIVPKKQEDLHPSNPLKSTSYISGRQY